MPWPMPRLQLSLCNPFCSNVPIYSRIIQSYICTLINNSIIYNFEKAWTKPDFSLAFSISDERSEEFRRSEKESLSGPFQTTRSDGIKPEIGIERKNISAFKVNMYINTFFYTSVSRKGVCRYYFRRRLSANVG